MHRRAQPSIPLLAAGLLVALSGCRDDGELIGAIAFTDVTAAAGLAYTALSYDAAFADTDGDGDLDLVVSNHGTLSLFENDGAGGFRDATQARGLARQADYHGLALADVDGDGRPDLYTTIGDERGDRSTSNLLWVNGTDAFHLAEPSPIAEAPNGRGRGAAFADLTNDGQLDLVVTNFATPPGLCIHDGEALRDEAPARDLGVLGHLVCIDDLDGNGRLDLLFSGAEQATILWNQPDGFRAAPLADSGGWLGVATGDLDGDGIQDLVAARYRAPGDTTALHRGELRARLRPSPTRAKTLHVTLRGETVKLMLEGEGKWWSPQKIESRPTRFDPIPLTELPESKPPAPSADFHVYRRGPAEIAIEVPTGASAHEVVLRVGGDIADWHAEGLEPGDPRTPLDVRRGLGAGRFEPWTEIGLDTPAYGAIPLLEDFDNNGATDIYLVGIGDRLATSQNLLFLNRGDGAFVECATRTGAAGPPDGVSFGACAGDIDADGDLDLFLVKGEAPAGWDGGPRILLRNDLAHGRHWIDVLPTRTDRGAVHGALVTVTAGGVTQSRRFALAGHPQSRGLRPCHFGLGDTATVDAVRVTFLDGTTVTVEHPEADQLLTIR